MLAVTGITGHTGRFLLDEFVRGGYSGTMKCLVRNQNKAEKLLACGLNIEIVEGNIKSEQALRNLFNGVNTVIHIAGIRYSLDVLRIGMECGVKRFILIHTTGIYSKFKEAADGYKAIESQILPILETQNITILRPTMIFGDMCDHNISKFIRFVDTFPVLPIVDGGKSVLQPVNARDLAQGIYKSLYADVCKGKAYDLSGEKPISLRQLYLMIGKYLGKKRLILSVPMWLCVVGAIVLKVCSMDHINVIEKVQRMSEDRAYSHADATADFGYFPEPFAEGLKREVEEYLSRM